MAEKCRSYECGSMGGAVWVAGWLFTIGYLHLGFWQGVLGIIVWPYFLGAHLAG